MKATLWLLPLPLEPKTVIVNDEGNGAVAYIYPTAFGVDDCCCGWEMKNNEVRFPVFSQSSVSGQPYAWYKMYGKDTNRTDGQPT